MRNRLILPLLLTTLLVPAPPALAKATTQAGPVPPTRAALGRGFGRRSPSFGLRSRPRAYRPRAYRRPRLGIGHFFGNVLKFLGLAYLFNALFGWGPGGSPFGLLLLVGVIVLLASRRRRRPSYYY
jgi:hypothetical protein